MRSSRICRRTSLEHGGSRSAGDLGHPARAEGRLPMVRLPGRVWPFDHGLQPLQPLVAAGLLAQAAGRAGRCRRGDQEHRDRQHLGQGAALGLRWQRGAPRQAIGRSRGGWTTKVHALTDVIGRPYALTLTPGNVADVKAAPELLARLGARTRYLLADKGYDADALRRSLRQAGAVPVIPGRCSRKRVTRYDKQRYRDRHLIENAFCRLKDFRRVATRYDKLAANFLSGVALVTAVAFWL
jgi:transposase